MIPESKIEVTTDRGFNLKELFPAGTKVDFTGRDHHSSVWSVLCPEPDMGNVTRMLNLRGIQWRKI